MKLFKLHRLKHWSYLADFIVIVAGILVALSLDNWNNERQRHNEEVQFLIEVKTTLQKDLDDALINVYHHQSSINAIDTLTYAFENNIAYDEALIKPFSGLLRSMIFLKTEGPLNVMQSQGLNLISNDIIRKNLLRIYGLGYPAIDAMENELPQFQHFNLLFDYVRKNFFRSPKKEFDGQFDVAIEPISYKHVSTDTEFRLLLAHTRKWRTVAIQSYERIIEGINSLLIGIDAELGIEQEEQLE